MTTETKLEPCAHCGGAEFLIASPPLPHMPKIAQCRKCLCGGPVTAINRRSTRPASTAEAARQQALEEAAKVADAAARRWFSDHYESMGDAAQQVAARIRALVRPEPEEKA